MRRPRLLETALLLVALLLAGVVWLTYHPESEILHRATQLPGIGPLAARLQRTYLPPLRAADEALEAAGEGAPSSDETAPEEPIRRVDIDWEAVNAHPFEWFVTGVTVHELPERTSKILFTLDNPARFGLLERRGAWARIRPGGQDAWILVDASTVSSEPPLGKDPIPVTAVAGRPPDQERLNRAVTALGPKARTLRLGPYPLYTDLPDGALLLLLDRAARHHEEGYRRRYRLPLRDQPRAAVVLFSNDTDYRHFQEDDARLSGLRASGHAGYGIVALFTAGSADQEIVGTLIHELSHLTNRRAIGPALPPWLDEGLAEDLAGFAVGPDGRLKEGTWRGERSASPGALRWTGTIVDLKQIEARRAQGTLIPLKELLALPWESFVRAGEPRLRYAHSALWVRFLLRPEGGLADPFRAFLGSVAGGESPTPENLVLHLGRGWEVLEQEFRSWVQQQAALRS